MDKKVNFFYSKKDQHEIELRVSRLQKKLANEDAVLISSNTNLYYLSGRFFRGYVYLSQKTGPLYFVVKPEGMDGKEIMYIRKPEQIPEILSQKNIALPVNIGLECNILSYADILRLKKLFPNSEMFDCSSLISDCRMIKTPFELELMREDGIKQAAVYSRIRKIYRNGMTDLEFQIEIERILRLEGCLGYSRKAGSLMEINLGSVISGRNADSPTPYEFSMGGSGVDSSLPVGANGEMMLPGTTVMVDMNGAFNAYQTDMTRVWCIGEIPEIAYKAHDCSKHILRELEKITVPGVEISLMYKTAEDITLQEGLHHYFMGYSQKVKFIGHGVGIELNEQPAITSRDRREAQENMTLAIEPKFVIPDIGAVGVENTYIVTPSGLENITVFPEEIERLDY